MKGIELVPFVLSVLLGIVPSAGTMPACPEPIAWKIASDAPLIKPGFSGDLDAKRSGAAHVIFVDGRYLMYYWGTGTDGYNRICVAESQPGAPNGWRPRGSVLERQPDSEDNAKGPAFPFVLPRDDGPWLMYVTGWGTGKRGRRLDNQTLLALSTDRGKTWKYAGDKPILPLDQPYDQQGTGSVWVIRKAGQYRMYYTTIGGFYPRPEGVRTGHGDSIPDIGIGYAISTDGIRWSKPYHHWLVPPRRFEAEPYEYVCSKPCMVEENGGYRMWVSTFSTAYRIRSLISKDGIYWKWTQSPPEGELGVGPAESWDGVQRSYLSVIRHNDAYEAWYTGNQFGATGLGHATATAPH